MFRASENSNFRHFRVNEKWEFKIENENSNFRVFYSGQRKIRISNLKNENSNFRDFRVNEKWEFQIENENSVFRVFGSTENQNYKF